MSATQRTLDQLDEVKTLISQGALPQARSDLQLFLKQVPDNVEALYMLAVTARYSSDYAEALAVLERLKLLAPSHSRAHQEEGHVHRDAGDPDSALLAYQRALALNPALESALRAQHVILTQQHQVAAARQVEGQLEHLLRLPKPLRMAMELVSQNQLVKAENLCRQFLQLHPQHVEGMRLLADIGVRLGVLEDAEFLLESALAFAPDNVRVRMDYVQVLRKRQKFAAALAQAQALLDSAPDNPQFRSLCAIETMQTGDFDAALVLLDQVLQQVPDDAVTLTTKGHALKTCGRGAEAVAAYRRVAERHPTHGEAYYSLANLKTYRFADDEIGRMQAQERNGNLGYMDRVYLNFALAKAFEDRADFEAAFSYYAAGNGLKKAQSRYDAQQIADEFAVTQSICTPELFTRAAGAGHPAPDPIFVVGLPRAGSTLLEQILSSHSQVDGTLELPNIVSLSQRLRRESSYPSSMVELSGERLRALGEEYLEGTRIHRQSAPFFVDKMPNNFRHIGLIKLILPNAKIIDARRSPMACCFSGYKQLFAEGQEFSYNLDDLGRYYRDYVSLMDHWHAVLPGDVLQVDHEAVVADLETQVRRLLEFCELPFEDACLRYYETERNVRTPSSEQVRQPIFKDSVAQWRNFEPWLGELTAALGPLAQS
ncbi:MAG: sulfotransferase [Pseudomonadales bacterium]